MLIINCRYCLRGMALHYINCSMGWNECPPRCQRKEVRKNNGITRINHLKFEKNLKTKKFRKKERERKMVLSNWSKNKWHIVECYVFLLSTVASIVFTEYHFEQPLQVLICCFTEWKWENEVFSDFFFVHYYIVTHTAPASQLKHCGHCESSTTGLDAHVHIYSTT